MNLPLRSMFMAPKGKLLLAVDLSQAESWVVAYSAREPSMKEALLNSDIHTETAMALFNVKREEVTKIMRYIGKRNNHAKAYRMKYPRMAQVINKDSDKPPYVTVTLAESRGYSEAWERKYCYVPMWWQEIERQLSINRTLTNCYGFSSVFYGPWGEELFKAATAWGPQSTVAFHFYGAVQDEIGIKGGLLEIHNQVQKPSKGEIKIVNTSHDSALLEVPTQLVSEIGEQVKQLLLRPMAINGELFTIPVDAEVGERYGEMEKL